MNIARFRKQLVAIAESQGIILLQQIMLPPLLIRGYGVAVYGEWLVLSAAAAYLNTLNFGVQTFTNNELAIRYERGEMAEYQTYQSTALRMLIGTTLTAAVLMSAVFLFPLNGILHLDLSRSLVSATAYLLGFQIIISLPLNYLTGAYLVFGRAHRGTSWQNFQRLTSVMLTVGAAWQHASFIILALLPILVTAVSTLLVLKDLKLLAPDLYPTLKYWNKNTAIAILKPSASFAVLFSSNFVVYQLPIILLQRALGPASVVAFTVMRTLFSMVRQGLACFTWALGPEITQTYALKNWVALGEIYTNSERFLFTLIPVLNLAVLMGAPLFLALWLHRPELFSLTNYALMAAISCTISAKEHKHQFQFSTNTHQEMAKVILPSYILMVSLSYLLIPRFGIQSFLWCWLTTEVLQTGFIINLNVRLLTGKIRLSIRPVVNLCLFTVTGTLMAAAAVALVKHRPLLQQMGVIAIAVMVLLLIAGLAFRAHEAFGKSEAELPLAL